MNQSQYYNRNAERNQKIYAFYLEHLSVHKTAEAFGLGRLGVRTVLQKFGVKFSKKRLHEKSACNLNKELVFEMADAGCTLAEIARKIGTSGRHVHRFLKENGKDRKFPTVFGGEKHYNWKGGRYVDDRGYVHLIDWKHPNHAKHTGHVYEHRVVMEKHLGRYLNRGEVVHHKNGNPSDNRIENLELFSKNSEHLAKELKGRCPNWTLDGIHRMQEAFARRTKHPRTKIHRDLKRDVFA